MTTVAYSNGYLAADRQATINGVRSETTKIRKCGRFWYAMAGTVSDCLYVATWLARGAKPDEAPNFDEADSYGFAIKTGKIYTIEGRVPTLIQLEVNQHAAGSGREFALAAMAMGHSAKEAVELACKFDVYSGCGVDVVKVGRVRGRR